MILFSTGVAAADPEKGKEINATCAACHGEYGHGGKRGEYPRLGGQRAAYLEDQLHRFRSRKRLNIPMFPYTQERELSNEDIKDIAAYLSSIALPTKPPEFKDTDDAYTRLLAMEKVMVVPKIAGDLDNGKRLYNKQCAACHDPTGMGRGKFPMLVGQYINYLRKQIDAYMKGERPHDDDDEIGVLATYSEQDINDVLAYITRLQAE